MVRGRRILRWLEFGEPALAREIRVASRGSDDDEASTQAEYLGSYLATRQPRPLAMLVEERYVDRHYLEEFAGYYGTMLRPPPSCTTRIHFFSAPYDDRTWTRLLARAAESPKPVEDEVSREYLGFVVVRPIASCPIGRTVLRAYDDDAARHFEAAEHVSDVHLCGLTLRIRGLAFQQQDQAVGACATTSLWSALSRVSRSSGTRPVTPLAITNAASRAIVTGRTLPANSGLTVEQMLGAIREFGFSPEHLVPKTTEIGAFKLCVKTYLRSGIPVVVWLHTKSTEFHTITLVGYRECDGTDAEADISVSIEKKVLRTRGVAKLYGHDDRLGPYSRWILGLDGDGFPTLAHVPHRPRFNGFTAPSRVRCAIIPHYPKMRLSAEDLLAYAAEFLGAVRALSGGDRDRLKIEPFFAQNGDYLCDLMSRVRPVSRAMHIAKRAELSRWVGVVRFWCEGDWHADFVLDTTDIYRTQQDPPLLLVTAAHEGFAKSLRSTHLGRRSFIA